MSMIGNQILEMRNLVKRYNEPPFGEEIDGTVEILERAISTIQDLSAKLAAANMQLNRAHSGDGWTPMDVKNFPEEDGWYQCTCFYPKIWEKPIVRDLYFRKGLNEFVDNVRYSANGGKNIGKYFWTEYVTAWMPLPEAYKKEV